jgi:anion-transporting  ArsA/GET3 family ATPase
MGLDKKEEIQEIADELKNQGPKQTLRDLHREYGIDQRELGKIILISSLAIFVVSAPAAITLQETHDQVDSVNTEMDQVQGMITSDSFQQSMTNVEGVGGSLARNIQVISEDLRAANSSISELETTETTLGQRAQTYKWISLFSLTGIIAGIVTIYI